MSKFTTEYQTKMKEKLRGSIPNKSIKPTEIFYQSNFQNVEIIFIRLAAFSRCFNDLEAHIHRCIDTD